jgi:hypothetical protein
MREFLDLPLLLLYIFFNSLADLCYFAHKKLLRIRDLDSDDDDPSKPKDHDADV